MRRYNLEALITRSRGKRDLVTVVAEKMVCAWQNAVTGQKGRGQIRWNNPRLSFLTLSHVCRTQKLPSPRHLSAIYMQLRREKDVFRILGNLFSRKIPWLNSRLQCKTSMKVHSRLSLASRTRLRISVPRRQESTSAGSSASESKPNSLRYLYNFKLEGRYFCSKEVRFGGETALLRVPKAYALLSQKGTLF